MEIKWIIFILASHFIADFIWQTDEMAKGKGVSNNPWNLHLFQHCVMYSGIIAFLYAVMRLFVDGIHVKIPIEMLVVFVVLFITHYLTDWVTSRVSKYYFDKGDTHNGFVTIGFDQVIHYLTLIWLINSLV